MSRYWNEKTQEMNPFAIIRDIAMVCIVGIASGMAGCPIYNVWQQGLAGEAALKRAEQDRRIAVQEAQAKFDSAKFLADADIARATGVAQANKIIGDSLKGNESYLRYLWITDVAANNKGNTVVYVPTEANMPILEAGKRP
jgi:regulator of protease activity HflC (stomatin/prohibitin superfamily)